MSAIGATLATSLFRRMAALRQKRPITNFHLNKLQTAAAWSNLAWTRSAQEQRCGIGQQMFFVPGRELDHQLNTLAKDTATGHNEALLRELEYQTNFRSTSDVTLVRDDGGSPPRWL
jgi:hypothetical protein